MAHLGQTAVRADVARPHAGNGCGGTPGVPPLSRGLFWQIFLQVVLSDITFGADDLMCQKFGCGHGGIGLAEWGSARRRRETTGGSLDRGCRACESDGIIIVYIGGDAKSRV
jgi:hypothetical protein